VVDSLSVLVGRKSKSINVQDCHNAETPLLEMAMYQQSTAGRRRNGVCMASKDLPRTENAPQLYEERGEREPDHRVHIFLYNWPHQQVGP
jgi:hypothetical protein